MTPMTTMTTHILSNKTFTFTPIAGNPLIINKMLKKKLGISDNLEVLTPPPEAGTQLGLANILDEGASSGAQSQSS